jgi:hypothetical protein
MAEGHSVDYLSTQPATELQPKLISFIVQNLVETFLMLFTIANHLLYFSAVTADVEMPHYIKCLTKCWVLVFPLPLSVCYYQEIYAATMSDVYWEVEGLVTNGVIRHLAFPKSWNYGAACGCLGS